MLLYFGVTLTTFVLFGLAYFLLAQNRKTKILKTFGSFLALLAVWVVINFIGANFKDYSWSGYFVYADFLTGPWVVYVFWRFVLALLAQVKVSPPNKLRLAFLIVTASSVPLVLSGQAIRLQTINGTQDIEYGSLFWLYGLGMAAIIVGGVAGLVKARRLADRQLRVQLKAIDSGLYIVAFTVFVANLIIPQVITSETVNLFAGNIAYLGVIYFGAVTSYAILRHKLFDIRLVVARSIGYTLLLSAVTMLFAALVITLSFAFNSSRTVPLLEQLLYVIPAIAGAFAFAPLKRLFDKLTNRYFYQDAYDPRILFDDYNKALVSTIDLDELLKRTTHIIADCLKVEYCTVFISNKRGVRVIGSEETTIAPNDASNITQLIIKSKRVTIVTDELTDTYSTLEKALQENNVGLIRGMDIGFQSKRKSFACMILGNKKSGNVFSGQDVKVIEALCNELVIALQNALRFEEIEQFNETLRQKVEDATRQLRESNKKLKQLNESKDDFIGMASHQLRTPLTSVKGYISLVMDGDAGRINKDQKKLLQQAFFSSQKMVFLVADLLNVSRLKTGKFVIERSPINLNKLISEEMEQLKQEAAGRGLELTYEAPKDFPTLPLDETKTRQVVMNFLDNAIYYTPSGGHIRAELKDLPKSIEFRVVDDGIGVPKDERHRLFTKFYRARNAQRARPDGTGLGLYMARKVITAQGGALIFSSEEGKGSTFGFTFPKDMPSGNIALPAQTRD